MGEIRLLNTYTVPYVLLITLHIVLVGVWLGADIGSLVAFRRLGDTSLSLPARRQMTLLTELLDVGPRSAMVLLFMLGLAMTYMGGWGLHDQIGGWFPPVVVAIALVWTLAVWHAYWVGRAPKDRPRGPVHQRIRSGYRAVELWLRLAVSAALAAAAVASLLHVVPFFEMRWIAWKLVLLLGISLCGVGLKYAIPRVRARFGAVIKLGSTPESEAALATPLRTAQALIVAIWVQITAMVYLSVVQPW